MKKEIVQYATGKFKHFDGTEREFTVCMASISPVEDWVESRKLLMVNLIVLKAIL